MNIQIRLTTPAAKLPTQAKPWDAGFDLYSTETKRLLPGCRLLFNTGIQIAIPEGFYGRIAPRSGLAWKHGIDILAGVIDSGYRDNVGVILYNTGKEAHSILAGERIAQLIIEKCYDVTWQQVEALENNTGREGGFGSTGS